MRRCMRWAQSGPKSTPPTPFRAGPDGWVARTGLLPGELCPCSAAKNSRATSVRRGAIPRMALANRREARRLLGDPPGYFQSEWAHVVVEDFERAHRAGSRLDSRVGEAWPFQLLWRSSANGCRPAPNSAHICSAVTPFPVARPSIPAIPEPRWVRVGHADRSAATQSGQFCWGESWLAHRHRRAMAGRVAVGTAVVPWLL
jgi:hypothetical protein